ncbi:hypothetical protein [Rugosimonospora africana]|uniref:DUF1453 domain-containing protein n=1 Tax=Rugosimonospora africana TaxID=556532 RepID=A0A8J3QZ22_9ACTN|nr:hypothetical protein [Rugosimonospora africana]GIH19909.1 hypothetical protein Raf01_80810 [Rugosimonospora africana]
MEPDPTGAVLAATPTSGPASTLPAVLTVAILLLVLLTRIRGRELSPGRVLTLPLILVALGLGSTVPQLSMTRLHTIDAVVLAVDVLISLGLGGVRGFTVLLYPNGGRIWYRYGPLTVALWFLSIALRAGLAAAGAQLGATALVTTASVLLMFGLTLATQNVILIGRLHGQQGQVADRSGEPAESGAPS